MFIYLVIFFNESSQVGFKVFTHKMKAQNYAYYLGQEGYQVDIKKYEKDNQTEGGWLIEL